MQVSIRLHSEYRHKANTVWNGGELHEVRCMFPQEESGGSPVLYIAVSSKRLVLFGKQDGIQHYCFSCSMLSRGCSLTAQHKNHILNTDLNKNIENDHWIGKDTMLTIKRCLHLVHGQIHSRNKVADASWWSEPIPLWNTVLHFFFMCWNGLQRFSHCSVVSDLRERVLNGECCFLLFLVAQIQPQLKH